MTKRSNTTAPAPTSAPAKKKKPDRSFWKRLLDADRWFMSAAVVVDEALGEHGLKYRRLSPEWMRRLEACDRETLFTLHIECLGRLTGAPALGRVRDANGRSSEPHAKARSRKGSTNGFTR